MYMYYFLGYNITMGPYDDSRKLTKAENTFLLALDGDVDFEPLAVILLVDLMKRNDKVAAACGRIHPTGSGSISMALVVVFVLFQAINWCSIQELF